MPRAPELPDPVRAVCSSWLRTIDEQAPGLVTGLYLRGGLAFGEWVPGQSDVDFVATLSAPPTAAQKRTLQLSHAETSARHRDVAFDGMHVLADDLTRDPEVCPDVPCVVHGLFDPDGREDLNPVAWHEVAERGIAVRGPAPGELDLWTDPARLAAFTRENLDSYWRPTAEALGAMPREAEDEDTCCWCVLGVVRLHHLLVTGRLTTKSGAGRWALTHYDEKFHRVVREALRVRDGGPDEYVGERPQRGLDTAAFTAYVVAAGILTHQ